MCVKGKYTYRARNVIRYYNSENAKDDAQEYIVKLCDSNCNTHEERNSDGLAMCKTCDNFIGTDGICVDQCPDSLPVTNTDESTTKVKLYQQTADGRQCIAREDCKSYGMSDLKFESDPDNLY